MTIHEKNIPPNNIKETLKESKFLNEIIGKEDLLVYKCSKLKNPYIYGGGVQARQILKILSENGINIKGMAVDKKYIQPTLTPDICCLDELMETTKTPIDIIIGFINYVPGMLNRFKDKISEIVDIDTGGVNYDAPYTYDWVKENAKLFQEFYDLLEDDLSKETLLAYVNQKISRDFKYLAKVKRPADIVYFDDEIYHLSPNEILIDCGAYIGDTAKDFVNILHKRRIETYDAIISLEPDPHNFEKLTAHKFSNHICIQKGAYNKATTMYFEQNGDGGNIKNDGKIRIETDAIDNILNGKRATIIKMDIEGSELAALEGAKITIQKYKPTIAVCVYHKRSDLLEIPQYIKSLVPEYKLYLRKYATTRSCTDLVLYAVL